MADKKVKDLMLSLEEYAVVGQEANLVDVLDALEQAKSSIHPHRQPPRAVLITDEETNIVGQLEFLDFLRALEPQYSLFGNLDCLSKAGLSAEFIDSMMENYNILQDKLPVICKRARYIRVKDVMRPVSESIDEEASVTEAFHKIVVWQSTRILVTRKGKVIGVLRLADLFAEIESYIRNIHL
ncbi:MAG: CBS domain-containing protein [candidate division Zixibacteria bacterium]|nr:CBS domain-containing protein [Candidatus Tariuqbacter arcticus]